MGKAFGLLALVMALWIGMEVYTKGMEHALGGALAALGGEESGEGSGPARPPTERVRDRVNAAHAEALARREQMLEE